MAIFEELEDGVSIGLVLLIIVLLFIYGPKIADALKSLFNNLGGGLNKLGMNISQQFNGTQNAGPGQAPGSQVTGFTTDDAGNIVPSDQGLVGNGFGGGGTGGF